MTSKLSVLVPLPAIREELEYIFSQNFSRVDADHDGGLNKEEFRLFLEMAGGHKNSKYAFEIVDIDHDGRIY
jgi:Ca2+-binding EF-hand superfamily protein